ncbi:MAG TPA: iron-containing alcohol dehydrogenase, partial [Bryobacteraceae bacterium]|nr:iron-containing alcohol dehydrogenase [Bryobacteraceae bacterium]
VYGEPTVEMVRQGAQAAREGCDLVIGFGGGSAIDAAKAIAALATNSGDPLDYLEVVGKGRTIDRNPLPFIAVPTTAGTGAEVTRNAVIGSPEHQVKASLRSPLMLAKIALIDPDLTRDVPPHVTASTGLDTLTQLIEPYVSVRANAMSDLFCVEGLKRVAASLDRVFQNGHDIDARESMSFASLLSGLALANAGLGAVHGFASPLGGMLEAPHGALCAAVLPHATAVNIRALRSRDYHSKALRRYEEIACILTGEADAMPDDGAEWIAAVCGKFAIPNLRHYGLDQGQIPELVAKAARASSMKANALPLTTAELTEIAERAL